LNESGGGAHSAHANISTPKGRKQGGGKSAKSALPKKMKSRQRRKNGPRKKYARKLDYYENTTEGFGGRKKGKSEIPTNRKFKMIGR